MLNKRTQFIIDKMNQSAIETGNRKLALTLAKKLPMFKVINNKIYIRKFLTKKDK